MKKFIVLIVALLQFYYFGKSFDKAPKNVDCSSCTNTKVIIDICNVNYYSNWSQYAGNSPLPNCYNEVGGQGYNITLGTDRSSNSADFYRNANFNSIPGKIEFKSCNFIYGGKLSFKPLTCNLYDLAGQSQPVTCLLNVSVPKIPCNKTRVIRCTLECSF